MKRVLSLLVAFMLVFSLVPLTTLADDDSTETPVPAESTATETIDPATPTETTPEPTISQAPASESPTPEALFLRFLNCDRVDSNGMGYLEVLCLPGDELNLEVKGDSNGDLSYRWQVLTKESNQEDPYIDIDPLQETTADEKALAIVADASIFGVENYYRCVVTATNGEETLEQYCYFTLVNDEPIQTPSSLLIESFANLGDAANLNVPANTNAEDIAFPSTLGATISGNNAEVAVTWTRNETNTPWENGGSYEFAPVLPSGYTIADGVKAPTITVLVAQEDSVSISIDPMFANPGDIVSLKATITGYEGASFQWQWAAIPTEEVQQALDARAASTEEGDGQQKDVPQPVEGKEAKALSWYDEAGATGKEYQFTATADNLNRYWRLKISLNDPQQFDTAVANADEDNYILTSGYPSMSTQGATDSIGRMTIFTSIYSGTGHSWIYIENTSNATFRIGSYNLAPGGSVSVGLWGSYNALPVLGFLFNSSVDGDGIYYNFEKYELNYGWEKFSPSASLSMNITSDDLSKINGVIGPGNNRYSLIPGSTYFVCTTFAVKIWNAVAIENDQVYDDSLWLPTDTSPKILYDWLWANKSDQANFDACAMHETDSSDVYKFVTATTMKHVSTLTYLLNPQSGEQVEIGQTVNLSWTAASGVQGYLVKVWKPNTDYIVYSQLETTNLSASLTMPYAGVWTWQVFLIKKNDKTGSIDYVDATSKRFISVKTPTITYTPPTPYTPATASYPANIDINFSWSDVGATLYKLEVYQNSSNKIAYNVGGTSKTIKISTPGTWHWKVSSMQNTATVLATSIEKTFTITAAPSGGTGTSSAPILQSPDDAVSFQLGSPITFSWSNTGATDYLITLICDTGTGTFSKRINGATTYTYPSANIAGNWRWQVQAYNGTTLGAAPHTRSFVVNAPATSNVGGSINVKYYNGVELSGNVLYEANVGSIHYNWGTNSPAGGVPADAFSARFTQTSYFNEGYYKFHYEVDDCIKIWIDGDCKVNQWSAHILNEYSSAIYITGGNHTIWVDYADINGEAKIIVDVGPCATPTMTLKTPANESTYTTNDTVQFGWNGVDIPGRYRVELTNETTGESKYFLTSKDTPYGQPFATLNAGKWHWRVLAMYNLATVLVYSPYGYFTVTTPPTVPDLEPIAITSSYIDGYLYFDSGIKNNTGITSNSFNVKWYVNGVLKVYTSHNGIQGNSTVYDGNNSFYFKPTASGTYSITYAIDVDNQIVESNEGNNTTSTQATIQIPAPLSISSVKADQSTADAWDTVTWTVGTAGGVGTKQYYYKLYRGTTLVNTPVWTTQATFKSTLIEKGSYTLNVSVKDNATTVSKTSAATIVTVPLSLTSVSTSASVVATGTRITWTANATGGVGTKQYCYLLYKDGSLFKQTAWSTTSSYAYTPTSVGSYYAEAWVRDSIDLYYIDSTPTKAVNPFAITSIECSESSSGIVTSGNASSPYMLTETELTWTVTTSGGDGDVIYYYNLYNGATQINTPEWTMQSSFTYTPTKAGTYTLKVTAKENTAIKLKTSAATKVIDPLATGSVTPSSTLSTTGKALSWSMKATGGTGTKYYCYAVYQNGTKIKQSSWSSATSYSYTPTTVGTYMALVSVKDLSDSLSRPSAYTKVVLPFTIQSVSCGSAYSTTGTQLTWTVTTSGGDGPIQYYYKLYRGTTLLSTTSWDSISSFSFTPSVAGAYSLKVYAKESTGAPTKTSATTKVIVPLSILSVNANSIVVTTRLPITWTVKAVGGDGTKQYYYELYKDATLLKTKTWGSQATFGFTPTETGSYRLAVSVKDASGTASSESASVKVVLPITITDIVPSASTASRGQQITWTVSATGGDGVKLYSYKLYCGSTLINEVSQSTSSSYSYTPTKAGSYSLKVYVHDNTPTVSKTCVTVKVV